LEANSALAQLSKQVVCLLNVLGVLQERKSQLQTVVLEQEIELAEFCIHVNSSAENSDI